METTRACLRYYGGKYTIAEWIVSHFPDHGVYVEPCGGGASVLFAKERSAVEVYSDLDGNVVNFFKVLRDQPDDLVRAIMLTPWARSEYELATVGCDDPLERARRFFAGNIMSISGMAATSGFRAVKRSSDARDRTGTLPDNLRWFAERLLPGDGCIVQIENEDYRSIVDRYCSDESLVYFDPPYLQSKRTSKKEYAVEWSDQDHIDAAMIMRSLPGHVIVSGYQSELYADLYEGKGWVRKDIDHLSNNGAKRVESIWLSPSVQTQAKIISLF